MVIGDYRGVKSPVDGIAADPQYLDVYVAPGKRKVFKVDTRRRAFAYVFEGAGNFRDSAAPHRDAESRCSVGAGSTVGACFYGDGDGRMAFFAEWPVARPSDTPPPSPRVPASAVPRRMRTSSGPSGGTGAESARSRRGVGAEVASASYRVPAGIDPTPAPVRAPCKGQTQ